MTVSSKYSVKFCCCLLITFTTVLRAEWAKSRAHTIHWTEEVLLLREEMRRCLQYLQYRADWWARRSTLRQDAAASPGLEKGLAEGLVAYAREQQVFQSQLAKSFLKIWGGSMFEETEESNSGGPVESDDEEDDLDSDGEAENNDGYEDDEAMEDEQEEVAVGAEVEIDI